MSKGLFIIKVFLAILSGILLIFAFPPFNLSGLAFIGLIPLLIVLKLEKGLVKSFIFSFLTGIIFFGGLLFWISQIKLYQVPDWLLVIGWLLITLVFGIYIGIFGLMVNWGQRWNKDGKSPFYLQFLPPLIWVSIEFIRSIFPLGGFPWGILGYSQYQNLMLIQIVDKTGVLGVSFLIVLVNVSVSGVLFQFGRFREIKLQRLKSISPSTSISFRVPLSLYFCLLLIVVCYIYGFVVMQKKLPLPDLKVAIIQSRIGIEESWNWGNKQNEILQRLTHLTKQCAKDQPSLTIWTETALLDSPQLQGSLRDKLSSLTKEMQTNLLVGAPHVEFKEKKTKYYNSAFLFSDRGEIINRYDKIHLVPFGEMLPLEDIFPIVRELLPQAGYYSAGRELVVFQKPVRFNVLICYEGVFGHLTRKFVKKGGQLLINITNDAWSQIPASYYQHFTMDIFRAIENKTYFLRAGNTGISAVITPYGYVKRTLDIGQEGVIIAQVSPMPKKTFYTKYGDIFAYTCLMTSLLLIFSYKKMVTV